MRKSAGNWSVSLKIAGVVVLAACLAACTSETKTPSSTTTSEGQKTEAPAGIAAARSDTSLLRFINADPDEKSLEIWSNNASTFGSVAYKDTTPYKEFPAHVGQFQLRQPGATKELAANHREMFPGRHYTLVALTTKKHGPQLIVLTDNLADLDSDRARVRLINATTDIDDMDLYIAGSINRVGHGVDAATASSFTDIDPGTLEIRPRKGASVPQFTHLEIQADRMYTFIITGTAASPDVIRVEDHLEK